MTSLAENRYRGSGLYDWRSGSPLPAFVVSEGRYVGRNGTLNSAIPCPRPTIPRRKHPDLTGFLIGCVGLVGFLFLATVTFAHVTERTLLTVAQGEARRGM